MKTIYLGADHAGFALKEKIIRHLDATGFRVEDLTPAYRRGDDYPRIGLAVATQTVRQRAVGILICGSGVGMAIAANRVKGARALEGHTRAQVKQARAHNHANVLTLGARQTSLRTALDLIGVFLSTPVSRHARHVRRVKQLG